MPPRFSTLARALLVILLAGCQPAQGRSDPQPDPTLPAGAATGQQGATARTVPTQTPEPITVPTIEPTPEPNAVSVAAATTVGVPQGTPAARPNGPPEQVASVPCPAPSSGPKPSHAAAFGAGPTFRPLVVQIDNAIPARPALNLTEAAAVYESVAEGGVTRFSAVYTREDPGVVGPVRSARLVSLEVARQFEALLVYHGASTGVQDRIWGGGIYFVSFNEPASASVHSRVADRPAPHNSVTRLPQVRAYARTKGVPPMVEDWPDFPRGDVTAPPAGAARRVTVGFSGPDGAPWPDFRADFSYAEGEGLYVRSTGGRRDTDGATRKPIAAETVVVQVAPVLVTDIIEDVYGSRSLDYQLQGEGKAHFFRGGQYWEGCWRRPGAFEPTTYVGPDGRVFPFGKGQVWIALANPNTPISRDP